MLDPAMQELKDKIPGFWRSTCRELCAKSAKRLAEDEKTSSGAKPTIYIPTQVSRTRAVQELVTSCNDVNFVEIDLDGISPDSEDRVELLRELNKNPGLLALATTADGARFRRYVVPGGRFNEMYGWDSYFIALGLIETNDLDLATDMLYNLCAEVEFYGMILNANRSYYIGRSQPPLLTDLALRLYKVTGDTRMLSSALKAAVIEYQNVWTGKRMDATTNLSKYSPPVPLEFPCETERGHYNMVFPQSSQGKYNAGTLAGSAREEIREYLRHDVGVRESGHDTSSRLHDICADLVTVDLNCLLYKYELDIEEMCQILGAGDCFDSGKTFAEKAEIRRKAMQVMWNEDDGWFYDYNCAAQKQHPVHSATALYALWSGVATPEQASKLVPSVLAELEEPGGLAAASHKDSDARRQWDWPAGWAPHQILAWAGLEKYGFHTEAKRLATSWTNMAVDTWVRTHKVMEKYDVSNPAQAHAIAAEYGNQGSEQEGFGWTNASLAIAFNRYF